MKNIRDMTRGELIKEYLLQYQRVNGTPATLTYREGWFTLNGSTKLRSFELRSCTEVLRKRPAKTIKLFPFQKTHVDRIVRRLKKV